LAKLRHAAEVEYCCAHFDECTRICTIVLKNARSLEDKLPVIFTSMISVGSRGMFSEALCIGNSALSQLRELLPKKTTRLSVIKAKREVGKELQGLEDSHILALPRMNNVKNIAAMKFLDSMARYAYSQMDSFSYAIIILKMMKLSLKSGGLDSFSVPAFAYLGILNQIFGQRDEAYRFAMLSIKLLQKLNLTQVKAGMLTTTYMFVMH
jgi:predicted ATPase